MKGRHILWALAAGVVGFGINAALPLSGPFGLDFLFGGAFAYLFAFLVKRGVLPYLVAIIVFAGQYYYWSHPATAIISFIEFAFIFSLINRFSPTSTAIIFSATLSPLLAYILYFKLIGMPSEAWSSIAVKNSICTLTAICMAHIAVAIINISKSRELYAKDFHRNLLLPVIVSPAAFLIMFNSAANARLEVERQVASWRLSVGAIAGEMIEGRNLSTEVALRNAVRQFVREFPEGAQARSISIYRIRRADNAIIEQMCLPNCRRRPGQPPVAQMAITRLSGDADSAFLYSGSANNWTWQRAMLATKAELPSGEFLIGVTSTEGLFSSGLQRLRAEFVMWVALAAFLVVLGWLFDRWALLPLMRMSRELATASASPNALASLPGQGFGELEELRRTIQTYARELHEANAEAKELDEQLSLIAERAPMVFATWRLNRRFGRPELVSCSAPPEERVGLSRAIFEDPRAASAYVHPEDRAHAAQMLNELRRTAHAGAEFRMIGLNGEWRWLLFRFSRRQVGDNDLELVGVVTDVTQANFILDHRAHRDRLAMMGRMVSGLAHELNQPLNVISMAAGNIANHVSHSLTDRPQTADYVLAKTGKMLAQVERASRLLAAVESVSLQNVNVLREVDIVKLAHDCIKEMSTHYQQPITLKVYDSKRSFIILADERQLHTVVLSILKNAVEFTMQSRLVMHDVDAPTIQVEIQNFIKIKHVALIVKDFGPGFEPKEIPFLFTPFSSDSTTAQGSGLSLAKCFSMIRAMDGEIYAKNHDNGAIVSIYFPVER